MYYIKKRDEDLYWYDFACGCHVWKSISRCHGWNTGKEAAWVLMELGLCDEAVVDFVREGEQL